MFNQNKEKPKTSPNDKVVKRRGWSGRFFIGVKKQTPCVLGPYQTYNDHWVVRNYDFEGPFPC